MSIYAAILITLTVVGGMYNLASGNPDRVTPATIGLIIYLPIFGRIFGWW